MSHRCGVGGVFEELLDPLPRRRGRVEQLVARVERAHRPEDSLQTVTRLFDEREPGVPLVHSGMEVLGLLILGGEHLLVRVSRGIEQQLRCGIQDERQVEFL